MSEIELTVGRYLLRQPIGRGGMASVHLARMRGPLGFTRTVAVKRLHKQLAEEPSFASMLVDEARLASRVRHPNVVPTLDVIAEDGELLLVMEYIHGEALSALITAANTRNERVPIGVGAAIVSAMLQGLHAAHEALDEEGELLHLVHRDVSPQNVLVDADGQTRIVDFGVAKARGRLSMTQPGEVRGKLGYMAPEQLEGQAVDRRVDVHAAAVVFWEVLAGKRLFGGASEGEVMRKLFVHEVAPPSVLRPEVPGALDDIILRGLDKDQARRYPTALEMAEAIEAAVPLATPREISRWVIGLAKDRLDARAALVASIERLPPTLGPGAQRGGSADVAADGGTEPILEPTRLLQRAPMPTPTQGVYTGDTVVDAIPAWPTRRSPARTIAAAVSVACLAALIGLVAMATRDAEVEDIARRGLASDVRDLAPSSDATTTPAAPSAAPPATASAGSAAPAASTAAPATRPAGRPWVRPPPKAKPTATWDPTRDQN